MARLAYALAMWINPNNHALDGGRASSAMEKEAVAELARMFGWQTHLGHLCSGGTMANLEALWVAGQLRPGAKIARLRSRRTTRTAHQQRAGPGLRIDPLRPGGRMDLGRTRTASRTAAASAPWSPRSAPRPPAPSIRLPEILALRERYGFRLHADAAYGGYFGLPTTWHEGPRRAFERLGEVDSIVIDPHKHGLQPYGCGCVLFRDPAVGRFYKHDSPYTYFSSGELHLGEISLECSRPGAAAVALWATQKLLPLVRGGEFARRLSDSRAAAIAFHAKLRADRRFVTAFPPELDIVVWAPRAARVSEASKLSRRIFAEAARRNLHLALAELPVKFFDLAAAGMDRDRETLTCLRSVLMKPEHRAWVDRIWEILDAATRAAGASGASGHRAD